MSSSQSYKSLYKELNSFITELMIEAKEEDAPGFDMKDYIEDFSTSAGEYLGEELGTMIITVAQSLYNDTSFARGVSKGLSKARP